MAEQYGTKETKELLIAMLEVTILIMDRLEDGFGVDDIVAVMSKLIGDKDFKDKLQKAAEGIKEIPKEVKDLKTEEVMELVGLLVPEMITIVDRLRKKN